MTDPLDTNVVVRYLVERPEDVDEAFAGVFPFFVKLEKGEARALLTPLVLFQTWFVLTSFYQVPRPRAAAALGRILSFRGLTVPEKPVLRRCLESLEARSVDLVDAYLAALCASRGTTGVYSFDQSLEKLGLELLPPG